MKVNNKNIVLALETTSKISGVALFANNKLLYESNISSGLNHSITLFTNIEQALKKSKLSFKDIDLIKVSNGPGSFTGIRIGIAAALGLSEAYNTKIEYVNTLKSLANTVFLKSDVIISMIDAKVDRAYIGVYNGKTLDSYIENIVVDIKSLCELLNTNFKNKNISFTLVGDGALNYESEIKKLLKINYKISKLHNDLKASSLYSIKGVSSKYPIINYILASKAERERNDKS